MKKIIFILITVLFLSNCEYFNFLSYEEWLGRDDDSSERGGSTYTAVGELDPSFDPGGGANNAVQSVAIQSDGRILIGGDFTSYYDSTTRNGIARVNADGSLDTSFDPGTGANNSVCSIAIQSDGRILIGGDFTVYNGTARGHIAGVNADGSLDTSFFGSGAGGSVYSIAIQSDGRILIGGYFVSYNGSLGKNGIVRVYADNYLDISFSGTGTTSYVYSIAIQSDGRILIGGRFSSFDGTTRYGIARVNANGSLDTSFDPGLGTGIVVGVVYTLAIQNDGRILIGGGFTSYDGTPRNYIARVNADGSLDTSFDPGSGTNDMVRSIAIQSDGKILIGGDFTSYNGTTRRRIARVNTDGSLDTSFDPGAGADNYVYSIAIQSDGRILIGGTFTSYDGTARSKIARIM